MRRRLRPSLAALLPFLAAVLGAARAAAEAEPRDDEVASVELVASRTEVRVGEPFDLLLRVAYDAAWFEGHGVPLVHRPTDLPVLVTAPDFDDAAGTTPLPTEGREGRTLVVNERVVRAAPGAARGPLAVLEVARRVVADAPGEVRLGAPSLRFARTTRFEADPLGGRVPVDRRDARVEGSPLVVRVLALPEEGRPPGFSGLVGRYEVRARAEPTRLAAGESLRLTLEVTGAGNLDLVRLPPLDLPGFHRYGALEESRPGRRTVRYDLSPQGPDVTEVPAIRVPYFDPAPPGAYRVAEAPPVPLQVTGPREGTGPAERAGGPLGPSPFVVAALAVLLLLLLVVLRRSRRRAGRAPTPLEEALEGLRAASRAGRTSLAAPFRAVLAARLGCAPAAVPTPDLAARLAAAGVPAESAGRAARTLEALAAADYSAERTPVDPANVWSVASEVATER